LKQEIRLNRAALLEIIHLLNLLVNRPVSATLKLQPHKPILVGEKSMPATILVGATASSLFQEWTGPNGTGTVVPNAGAPAFTSSNTSVATVDPASGVVTGVAAGQATITGDDPANNLSASDTITVNAPSVTAVSATLTLTAN
jgi:Bacterial Ig-like domain (group 2)